MAETRPKRQREAQPSADDIQFKAKIIMHADPFKEHAPTEFNKAFRALFGCGDNVALLLWKELNKRHLLPEGGTMTHLLWTLMFLKVYPSDSTMKTLAGADNKTIRKWLSHFIPAISSLALFLVRIL
jgi:hypothetical protein